MLTFSPSKKVDHAGMKKIIMGQHHCKRGFSLIELSIVLVGIALIVGGVLVGQDMIRAAEVRAAIVQIEKYQVAINTFRSKYNALPGDMSAWTADTFGFAARGACRGQRPCLGEGDGNGIVEGIRRNAAESQCGICESAGETAMFWVDLSTASATNDRLVDGAFNAATASSVPDFIPLNAVGLYLPHSDLRHGNYVYVYSYNHFNYFGLSAVGSISPGGSLNASPAMTVYQAYIIDKKVDDGYPLGGSVIAQYAGPKSVNLAGAADGTAATPASDLTCYDNKNSPGAPQMYSVEINDGTSVTCALSFRFQ